MQTPGPAKFWERLSPCQFYMEFILQHNPAGVPMFCNCGELVGPLGGRHRRQVVSSQGSGRECEVCVSKGYIGASQPDP